MKNKCTECRVPIIPAWRQCLWCESRYRARVMREYRKLMKQRIDYLFKDTCFIGYNPKTGVMVHE